MNRKITYFVFLLTCLVFAAWSAAPGEASMTVLGGLAHEATAAKGDAYEGDILIQNTGDTPQAVKIYQTDYLFYANGTNMFDPPGKAPRSNASWITFNPNYLLIPPKESLPVHYVVQVPPSITLNGTYWSLLMVEEVNRESEISKDNKGKYKIGIRTVLRSGIKIITNIGNTGNRKIKIVDKRVVQKGTDKIFQVDIGNTGERLLSPNVWIEIYDNKGSRIGKYEGTKMAIFPGTSIRQAINLPKLAKGKYKAMIIIDNGDEFVFGAEHKLVI